MLHSTKRVTRFHFDIILDLGELSTRVLPLSHWIDSQILRGFSPSFPHRLQKTLGLIRPSDVSFKLNDDAKKPIKGNSYSFPTSPSTIGATIIDYIEKSHKNVISIYSTRMHSQLSNQVLALILLIFLCYRCSTCIKSMDKKSSTKAFHYFI